MHWALVVLVGLWAPSRGAGEDEAPEERAAPPGAVRALVVTGGHGFEPSFFRLFDGHEGIVWRHAAHPHAHAEIAPDRAGEVDVLVLYDLWQGRPLGEDARRDIVALLEAGKGLLVLHHALASYGDWDEFRRIIGGRYFLAPTELEGTFWPRSQYRHDTRFRIMPASAEHPITRGLEPFEITDETYRGYRVEPGVTPLLRTDEPSSAPVIGWAKSYARGRVVVLQPGHGPGAWEHPTYRELVARSIRWAAPREPAGASERVLRGAWERIDRHRRGVITVRVTGASGEPVAGARVRVLQTRHQFLFGSNLFLWGRTGSDEDETAYRERFAALFGYATLPFYWRSYEPKEGQPDHESRRRVAAWCRERGIVTKGHPLAWNHPASTPLWLPRDAASVRDLSEKRVRDCVAAFRGEIEIWDAVNEATDPWRFGGENPMTEAMRSAGVTDWTLGAFRAARRANPRAVLIVNDYRRDDEYARLIDSLVEDGKPVYDAIGIQSHMHGGAWSPEEAWQTCERFTRFRVPLHFTESTIVSGKRSADGKRWAPSDPELEERQAREAVTFYTVLFSHPSVEAITWWDFADRGAWQGAAAGFLRGDLTPKPLYARLLGLIHGAWWTDEELVTDASGKVEVRAFYGDHEIRARAGEREVRTRCEHRRRGEPSSLEVSLGAR